MNYCDFVKKIEYYKNKYNVFSLGKSTYNRDIFAVEILKNSNFSTAFLLGSIHARENITTDLLCKMLDENLFDSILNFNITIIPMINPDGVELCFNGVKNCPIELSKKLLNMNKNDSNFSLWKANINGVDLNNNFDANFGTNIGSKSPSSSGYAGKFPESEVESKILADYTRKINPFFTISYHSKGEEIYYNFFQRKRELERDRMIAEKFSQDTGYIIKNPEQTSSGGYKDFCVQKLKIPSLTIEIGSDDLTHPISSDYLNDIFERHKTIAKDLEFAYNIFNLYK